MQSFIYNRDMIKYCIFDFNGTVIDDTDICIECENRTIAKYLDRAPLTREEYLEIFDFPVKEYYRRVGFDFVKHSYEEVGDYWYQEYLKLKDEVKAHEGVKELLEDNHLKGIKNVILSASRIDTLKAQISSLGFESLFDEILGLDDHYAFSKSQKGLDFIKDKNKEECILLGDTLHDLETARLMGIDCILIAKGHQAKHILVENYDRVVDDIREIIL